MSSIGSGGIALLALTAICWLLFVTYLFGIAGHQAHGDAAMGQALGVFAAILFAGLTWLWLGGLLLKAGTEDRMPSWAALPVTVLFLFSGTAVAACFFLIQDPKRIWPAYIAAVLPPIIALYVLALYLMPVPPFFSVAVWSVVLILSLIPWPSLFRQMNADEARRAEHAVQQEARTAQERVFNRAENFAKLEALTPEAPLTDWFPLLDEKSGVRTEALEKLRHVERRQADVEEMLTWGIIGAMMLLPDLDLKARPELCDAAKAFMLKNAKESRVRPKQDPREYDPSHGVIDYLPGIRWLMANGCDCDEGIAALEASVASYIESPGRNKDIALLAELRQKH